MTYTKSFHNLGKDDANIAGGKGASLGEMTNAKIPVPPGFVVLADSFEKFIKLTKIDVKIDAIIKKVNHKKIESVEQASKQIQELILNADTPKEISKEITSEFKKLKTKYVAIRSSATSEDSADAAWAGQLDSFLNTTENSILENVKKCWASLFTPRAIFYRFEKGLQKTKISVAVVVQKMVASEVSGIAFSVHPVTEDYNQLIIEAGLGLGEAIVSGQITPDSYVVSKYPQKIVDKNINTQERGMYRHQSNSGNEWKNIPAIVGEKQCLSDKQILEVANLIIKIENHYGFPCDIEWAYEKGKFYIVQSRPITTLLKKVEGENNNKSQSDLNMFTNTNTSIEHADGLPVYLEMTMAGFTDKLMNNHLKSYKIGISYFIKNKDEFDYFSLIQDQNRIGKMIIKDFLDKPLNINNLYKSWLIKYKKMLNNFVVVFDYNLTKFNDKKLLLLSEEIYTLYRNEISMPGFTDGFMFYAEKRLKHLVKQFCDDYRLNNFTEIFTTLTASTEPSFFNEKELDLSRALNAKSKSNILKKYAWINSSYSGYKPYTKENLANDLKDLKDPALAKKQLLNNKIAKEKILKKYKFNDEIKAIIKLTDLFIKWQDQRKVYTLTYVTLRSKILHEIARRFNFDAKILEYALTNELPLILDKKLSLEVIRDRRDKGVLFIHKNGNVDNIIVGEESESFASKIKSIENSKMSEINGTIASRGKAVGKVRIIMTAKNIHEVEDGEILVAPMTRPEHLVGMKKASAIITDDGGITCHAAIISRELGVPCIIGTKIATQVLKDGDMVEVDADNGVVKIIKN